MAAKDVKLLLLGKRGGCGASLRLWKGGGALRGADLTASASVLCRRRRVREKHHRQTDEVSALYLLLLFYFYSNSGPISSADKLSRSERPEIAPPLSARR